MYVYIYIIYIFKCVYKYILLLLLLLVLLYYYYYYFCYFFLLLSLLLFLFLYSRYFPMWVRHSISCHHRRCFSCPSRTRRRLLPLPSLDFGTAALKDRCEKRAVMDSSQKFGYVWFREKNRKGLLDRNFD